MGARRPQLEGDLRDILRDEERFPFSCVIFTEFAKGGDAGAPDCWIAYKPMWVPLELKLGSSVVKKLRPSQRRWHKDSLLAGCPTFGAAIDGEYIHVFRIELVQGGLHEVCASTSHKTAFKLDHLHQVFATTYI